MELHELSNTMTGALLSYVGREGGTDKIEAILELAGERRSIAELCDPTKWGSYDQAHALFTAAVLVMNDPDIGRAAGKELVRSNFSGLGTFLSSLKGPAEVIELVSEIGAKSSTVTDIEAVEVTADSALVSARTKSPITRDKIFCSYTAGVLSLLPQLFGMDCAEVTEIKCQARGDMRCLYKVTWDPSTDPEKSPERHIAYLKSQISALTDRMESLETIAADLVSESKIDDVLQTITMRASLAAHGQKYLLAVRLPGESELRIHSVGLNPAEARIRASEIFTGESDTNDRSRLVVDISSNRHRFGRLAVFYPEGYGFLPQEHRQLRAYAGHAAAALEIAAALDESRRRGDALSATLSLATELAQARTSQEVADTLARAIMSVVESDKASVLLWQPKDEIFILAAGPVSASAGSIAKQGFTSELPTSNSAGKKRRDSIEAAGQQPPILPPALRSPQLANRLSRLVEPLAIDKYNGDTAINGLLALAGVSSAIFVPVVWQSELYAVIVVGSDSEVLPQSLRASSDLTINERLKGVANIAAPVLRNALLLAQVQYEALHDQTTGLPNTRLLQDEIVRALSHAERQGNQAAILFVDLDNFSQVNDSLGHVAADDVLRATGMILRSAVRRGDVVARLAGDQFAVLLPNVRGEEDAKLVAYKVIRALEIPFNDFDQVVSISASVGIAVYPDHGTSYDELLGRSDIAMRRAKAGGGDRLVIFSS